MSRLKIDALDVYGKLSIYFHYYAVQMSIKHSFQIVDKTPEKQSSHNGQVIPWKHGRGEPDKDFGNIALYYLWKDCKSLSFEEFQKERIYDWVCKFEKDFTHI
jgi:hypothetical protein